MDNQKIILLTHEYPPKRGGAGVYCEELVNASQKLGFSIEAWVPQYAKENKHTRTIKNKGSQSWFCSYRIFKELSKRRKLFSTPTLLHFAEPGSLRAMLRFGWMIKKLPSYMITIHGTELIRFCKNPIEKILFLKILKQAEKIHVLSMFNRNELVKICPEIKNEIFLFPGAPARNLVCNKHFTKKLNKGCIKILCVGRIHPRKGQDILLNAIKKLPDSLKNKIECTFVGPIVKGNFFKKIRKLSKETNCKVSFLGDLPDHKLREIYQVSDLFVLPSMPRLNSVEGFGFVYLEASSYGIPILAHRTGGVEDAVKDGITGILSNPQNPNEFIAGLQNLLENESLRLKIGENGRAWAQKHCWEDLAEKIYS